VCRFLVRIAEPLVRSAPPMKLSQRRALCPSVVCGAAFALLAALAPNFADGVVGASGSSAGFAQMWSGSSWSVIPTSAVGGQPYRLNAVTCVSSALCFAVGNTKSPQQPVIEKWNGKKFKLVASPHLEAGGKLVSVSCVSANSCFAVGHAVNTGPRHALIEQWNGTNWSEVKSPKSPNSATFGSTTGTALTSISCTSANLCFAVGWTEADWPAQTALIEEWNGSTWSISSPDPTGGGQFWQFDGVQCVSDGFCVAVGSSRADDHEPTDTLIEQWNGTQWSLISNQSPDTDFQSLSAVGCASDQACFALGDADTGPQQSEEQLIEQWDGAGWTASPAPEQQFGPVAASCAATNACFGIGSGVEQWNGAAWSVVSSPGGSLSGVSCVASLEFCVAVD